jgi:hypothetical protein
LLIGKNFTRKAFEHFVHVLISSLLASVDVLHCWSRELQQGHFSHSFKYW